MIFNDFGKAVSQMGDGRFMRVLGLGLLLTLILLFAVYGLFLWFVNWLVPSETTILGYQVAWVNDLLSFASILVMLVLSIFLMVPVASAFTGLFLDDVAQAVEDKHYPHLPGVPRLPWTQSLADSLTFLGVIIVANLIALILYFFVNVFAPLLFWALNGYLLGREYFQMVAMRRLGRKGAKAARKKHFGTIWLAGILMAVPLSVPLLNLLIPVLGVATFTHIFHRLVTQDPSSQGTPANFPDQNA